jgi:hypothetical protein
VEEWTAECPVTTFEMSLDVEMTTAQHDHRHQEAIVVGTTIEVGKEAQIVILAVEEAAPDHLTVEMDGIGVVAQDLETLTRRQNCPS